MAVLTIADLKLDDGELLCFDLLRGCLSAFSDSIPSPAGLKFHCSRFHFTKISSEQKATNNSLEQTDGPIRRKILICEPHRQGKIFSMAQGNLKKFSCLIKTNDNSKSKVTTTWVTTIVLTTSST